MVAIKITGVLAHREAGNEIFRRATAILDMEEFRMGKGNVHSRGEREKIKQGRQQEKSIAYSSVAFLANVNSCSCSLYVVVRPSVCRLSVVGLSVCNVRAPYSAD